MSLINLKMDRYILPLLATPGNKAADVEAQRLTSLHRNRDIWTVSKRILITKEK